MSASLVTFYSFKGGVGRTQALANVAVALARRGQRVIVVDMDLESPGLHRFFGPEVGRAWTEEELTGSDRRGVLEYFEDAIKLPDDEPSLTFLSCVHTQIETGRGSIRLLLPGRLDQTYPERVARLSFDALYQSFDGHDFVEAFRRQLVEADADFVLVDSRTGMTDVAGVCTFQLPNIIVAMFALHRQGIEGVRQVAKAIERARTTLADDGRRRDLLLVPARVDEVGDRRDEWVREAELCMRDVEGTFLGGIYQRIPYDPGVAFGEEIVVGLPQSRLSDAYERLTDKLLTLTGRAEGGEEREPFVGSQQPTQEAARRIERYASELIHLVGRLGRELDVIAQEMTSHLQGLGLALPVALRPAIDVPEVWQTLARDTERLVSEAWEAWRRGWQQRFRTQLEAAAEGESELIEPVIGELDAALKRGDLEQAKQLCETHTDDLRQATSRTALLRRDRLTIERLSRTLPDRDRRIHWLEAQLGSTVDDAFGEDPETTSAIIRNCLRLLLTERLADESAPGTAPASPLWSAYDVLCSHLADPAHETEFETIGAPLWRAAWSAYLAQDNPPPADDLLPTGKHVRAQLHELAGQRDLLAPLIHDLGDGISRAWRVWGTDRQSRFAALFRSRQDDPALRAALATLSTRLPAPEIRSILALWLVHVGFDAGIMAEYVRALLAEDRWPEAFFVCEAARRQGDDVPLDARSLVALRFALAAAGRDRWALVRTLWLQPEVRAALENTRPGLLLVVLLAADLLSSARIAVDFRQDLGRYLLHESTSTFPAPVTEWLRWLERHPDWDGSVARQWGDLKQQLNQVVESFRTRKGWSPSLTIQEEFRAYWERRYHAVTDPDRAPAVKPLAAEDWLKQAVRKAASQGADNTDPHGTLRTSMLEKFGAAERILAEMVELSAGYPAMVSSRVAGEATRREAEEYLVAELQELGSEETAALLALLNRGPARYTGEGTAEQPLTPAGVPELVTLPLLLVRFDEPAPWQRYRDDLLQWSIGARDWATAVRDYIDADRFGEAARAIQSMESGVEQAQSQGHLDSAWQQWRAELRRRISSIESDAARLHAQQGDMALLDDAREHTRAVEEALRSYDDARTGGMLLGALVGAPVHLFRDCKRRLDDADVALALAQEDLQERRRLLLEGLRKLKEKIDAIANELLLDPQRGEHVEEWTRRGNLLLRAQDASGLERLLSELQRFQAGEIDRLDLPEIPAPSAPRPMPPATRPRDAGSPPALSYLAQELIATPPRERDGEPDLHLDDFSPGREWSRGKLDAITARCLRSLRPLPPSERYGRQEMGCLLVAQAQTYLLAGELLEARALFGDVLGWVTWQRREQAMRELSVRLWHEPCVWGFTLAFLLPYLGGQDRARILTRPNLGALFLQPFRELPLDIIARHDLLEAYARQMHMLDAEAGVELLRYFVLPYLREHPIAEQDFAAGLLGGQGDAAALARYLEVLLQPVVPDTEHRLRSVLGELPQVSTRERRMAMFLVALRAWLGEHAQSSGLAQALVDAAEQAGGEPGRSATEAETQIASSLMTREVVLAAGVPARLVLAVTGQDGIAPLYELRADVVLLDENDQQLSGALAAPPLIDRLRAGERREIPVSILLDPADAQRARRVQVRYSTAGTQGQWQYLKAARQSHAVAIRQGTAESERDVPMPYLVGRPVDRRDDIYGRDDKVDEIFTYLQGREQDNAVLVLGDRRIGKTTLLHAVKDDPRRNDRYALCVKIDQQDLDHRPQTFFGRLIRDIQSALTAHDLPRHSHERRELDRDPAYAFRGFMAAVDRDLAARGLRMLIILDELEKVFELIFRRDRRGRSTSLLPPEVIGSLRSVIQDSRRISFLLAGVTDGVRPYLETPEGRLFQMAHSVELDPLDRKASRELIERPAAQHYEVAPPAAEHLVSQTGGQPYLLQRIGAELFRHMRRRRARLVSVVDVDEVLEQRILPDTAFFAYLITPWRERERFSLLKALAHLQSGSRYVAVPDIARRLSIMGVSWEQAQVMAELEKLCKQVPTVLRRYQKRFRLEVELLARHIRWLDRPGLDLVLRL
jgi:MinD-like ATPase involved in chromosome partitioning or flagellar assembly